jgi:hypothetical protein
VLFLVALAIPVAAILAIAGPVLWWVGALPWPGLDDFARTESVVLALRSRFYLVFPCLAFGLWLAWALMAAGLAAAWQALDERGALAGLSPERRVEA